MYEICFGKDGAVSDPPREDQQIFIQISRAGLREAVQAERAGGRHSRVFPIEAEMVVVLTRPPRTTTVMEVRDVNDARLLTKENISSSCEALSGVRLGALVQGVEARDLGIYGRRMQTPVAHGRSCLGHLFSGLLHCALRDGTALEGHSETLPGPECSSAHSKGRGDLGV